MSDQPVPDYTKGYSPESRHFPYPTTDLLPPLEDHEARFEAASQWVDLLMIADHIVPNSPIFKTWQEIQRHEAIELVNHQREVIAAVRSHLVSVVDYYNNPTGGVNAGDMTVDERLAGAASSAMAALDIIDGN